MRYNPYCGEGDSRNALELLEANHDNLRAAVDWSLEAGETETALRLVGDLGFLWIAHRYVTEGNDKAERALAATGDVAARRASAGAYFGGSYGDTACGYGEGDGSLRREHRALSRSGRCRGDLRGQPTAGALCPGLRAILTGPEPLLEDAMALEGLEADP